MNGEIFTGRAAHVDALYGVLNHVDLGADAANLYRPGAPERAWADDVHDAYQFAPGRLTLHALPLVTRDAEALERTLSAPTAPLDDEHGRKLCELVLLAMSSERDEQAEAFAQGADTAEVRSANFLSSWGGTLANLRKALHHGRPSPILYVLDSASLAAGDGAWTHGRALTRVGLSIIAVSLDVPPAHALIQVFHEEIHRVTDPLVLERLGERAPASQDTRRGTAGASVHALLEEVAVAHGEELIRAVAPELLDAYAMWRERWGVDQFPGSST